MVWPPISGTGSTERRARSAQTADRAVATRLNLGCSDALLPVSEGWINTDICVPEPWSERYVFQWADLSKPWPWPDSTFDYIRAHDIIEHLADKVHTMNEAWRVLKAGGTCDIAVPTTDGPGAWQDPTHVSYWNRNSFMYFEAGNPHLVRFAKAYGVKCAFRIVEAKRELLVKYDSVVKLAIVLEAVK